ncbi:hypothetical protein O3P69_013243 [Scylla paramamosain]|uniref:Photolyase/cryptochrome alpha/beta domain-containing protein n=1 Tax=Scylla paramamosain TaxID=85552 RepID=A0AAW0U2I3_SCYPA
MYEKNLNEILTQCSEDGGFILQQSHHKANLIYKVLRLQYLHAPSKGVSSLHSSSCVIHENVLVNECQEMRKVAVHWFRHGLRLHDNPALLEALQDAKMFYAIFIFDGESAGTKFTGYNRQKYLTESLLDMDQQLKGCWISALCLQRKSN